MQPVFTNGPKKAKPHKKAAARRLPAAARNPRSRSSLVQKNDDGIAGVFALPPRPPPRPPPPSSAYRIRGSAEEGLPFVPYERGFVQDADDGGVALPCPGGCSGAGDCDALTGRCDCEAHGHGTR
ncbi:hypothetical protein THAOC_00033, partial [Thalassiosira oceanica]